MDASGLTLNAWQPELLIRLVCAMLAGGLIGWNRHRAGKPAGIGTHALVALGAGLFVAMPAGAEGAHVDAVSRAIQGVPAGVGFLGAGEIFRDPGAGHQVTGLTSAAALWATAALGLTIMVGPVLQAGLATLLVLAVLELAPRLERRVTSNRQATGDRTADRTADSRQATGEPYRPIVSTIRNRASPRIIRAYASGARSSGIVSIIGRIPCLALNASASCESSDVPDGQPCTDRRPMMASTPDTSMGSIATPTMISVPP